MMLKITIPLGEDDAMPACQISPTVERRLTSRRFCRSPEVLREQASVPSPSDQVTSPSAKAAQAKARQHLDAVAMRMKRRRSHDDEFKQKILNKEAEAEGRARQHVLKILEKAKSHNEAVSNCWHSALVPFLPALSPLDPCLCALFLDIARNIYIYCFVSPHLQISQRVSRKLSFEASHRESLALKLANDMEGAEARRAKRVQMIVQRNAQRSSAAHVIGRTAKAKAEEKAHAAMSAVLAAAKTPPGWAMGANRVNLGPDAHDACSTLLAQIEARLRPVPSAPPPPNPDGAEAAGDAHDGREGNGQAFEELTLWMRSAETIELVRRCLVSLGAGPSPTQRQDRSRIVLAILCMAIDANVR